MPVSETLADLAACQYTPPNRTDPSSWWRDYMVRRSPGFQDPGPQPIPPPPASTTAALPPPPGSTQQPPGTTAGPVIVGGPGTETFPTFTPDQNINGMHPLRWLELYRGLPQGSLGQTG